MNLNPFAVVALIILVAVSTLLILAVTRTAVYTTEFIGELSSHGSISAMEGLALDTETLDWGEIVPLPGNNKTLPVTVTNKSPVSFNLSFETLNWNPPEVQNHLNLTWNYNEAAVLVDDSVNIEFTLTVTDLILDIENYSFDVQIVGVQVKE